MLKEKLLEDMKISMREKNVVRKNVIQMVRAAILQIEKDTQKIEKKEEEFAGAFELLDKLALLNPDFISVTYGAGGGTSKNTVNIASHIKHDLGVTSLAHLTCVSSTRDTVHSVIDKLKEIAKLNFKNTDKIKENLEK